MKVAILGATGFLGSNLARNLSQLENLEVASLARAPVHRGSGEAVTPEDYYLPLIERLNPDVVINCVALVGHEICNINERRAYALNADFPKTLAQRLSQTNTKLLHFSTDAVFSGDQTTEALYSEGDETHPFSVYGSSKLLGETAVLEAASQHTVLRTNFFGWSRNGDKGVLDYFLHGLQSTEHTIGYGQYFVTSAFTDDLLKSVAELLHLNLEGLYHLTSSDRMSKYAFGREVARTFGFNCEKILKSDPSAWRGEGISTRDLSLSNIKIQNAGVTIPSQRDGIQNARKSLSRMLDEDFLLDKYWRRVLTSP